MPFFPTHHTARAADAADISALASKKSIRKVIQAVWE